MARRVFAPANTVRSFCPLPCRTLTHGAGVQVDISPQQHNQFATAQTGIEQHIDNGGIVWGVAGGQDCPHLRRCEDGRLPFSTRGACIVAVGDFVSQPSLMQKLKKALCSPVALQLVCNHRARGGQKVCQMRPNVGRRHCGQGNGRGEMRHQNSLPSRKR